MRRSETAGGKESVRAGWLGATGDADGPDRGGGLLDASEGGGGGRGFLAVYRFRFGKP